MEPNTADRKLLDDFGPVQLELFDTGGSGKPTPPGCGLVLHDFAVLYERYERQETERRLAAEARERERLAEEQRARDADAYPGTQSGAVPNYLPNQAQTQQLLQQLQAQQAAALLQQAYYPYRLQQSVGISGGSLGYSNSLVQSTGTLTGPSNAAMEHWRNPGDYIQYDYKSTVGSGVSEPFGILGDDSVVEATPSVKQAKENLMRRLERALRLVK